MPVKYEYDVVANIVHAYPYAALSIPEIREFFDEYARDDSIATGSIEVVHFYNVVDFLFSSVEAEGIISALARLREAKNLQATIFVGKRELHYGISRMLQILYDLDDPGYKTIAVRSDEELCNAIHEISGLACRPPEPVTEP